MASASTSRAVISISRWRSRGRSRCSTRSPAGDAARHAPRDSEKVRSDMVKAIVVHEPGGPEVLKWEDVEVGAPGPGEARVRHAAIGLNFVDVYNRTGLYKPP